MDAAETSPHSSQLGKAPIFSSAVQISRPKSASALFGSPTQQIKVAKLVLKPTVPLNKSSHSKDKLSPSKKSESVPTDNLRLQPSNKSDDGLKKSQQNIELENKTRKAETKTLNIHQQSAVESPRHKSIAMDEAARTEAREFMKRQREKRKSETNKEIDKSFIIKQRLDQLRKTTQNVITKPKKQKPQVKISPPNPKDFYSVNSIRMKEIRVLRLKPNSAQRQASLTDMEIPAEKITEDQRPAAAISPVRKAAGISSPSKEFSPRKAPTSPVKNPFTAVSKPMLRNLQSPTKADKVLRHVRIPEVPPRQSRPSSSKENKKPLDMKLKVPDVKLSMSSLNRMEVPPVAHQHKIPLWLQNTAIQPYPYNFIFAVRKKLEAYTSAEEAKRKIQRSFETPQLKRSGQVKKGRNFLKEIQAEPNYDFKHSTLTDESERVGNSGDHEPVSEANTISEISSIKSDLAHVKSKSLEKKLTPNDDDTTISESVFHSLKDDEFVGKKRESVNSDYLRSSLEEKLVELDVSPNTTQKRINFLSSTLLQPDKKDGKTDNGVNDLDKNKLDQEKEEEYQKMLTAFNQSLSNVIQVNRKLTSTVLSSKSSETSGTVRNYTSSFENNPESEETQKTSGEISELIENLVQQSQPVVTRPDEPRSESNSSIKTFIEDSKSTTLKPEKVSGDAIEDPPIIYYEPAVQEFSSSSTKVTTTMIVQQKISVEKEENTLNESKLLNMLSESFNMVDNNASFGLLMEKSSSEIKSWERTLTDRTRGQIAWLELQKQKFRKEGQVEKVSAIKKQQRAIVLRLEKERAKLKEKPDRTLVKARDDPNVQISENESEARDNIERILQQREEKLVKRRTQVEHLISWQRKLDKEEEKLKQMENDLIGSNMKKLSTGSKKKKRACEDVLNASIEMAKSIDKSMRVLERVKPSYDGETVEATGAELNKLWKRLTGIAEELYHPAEIFHLTKQNIAQFYEEAKETVMQSDIRMLLEASIKPRGDQTESAKKEESSDVSTMNSIANIETEEEYPGTQPLEEIVTTTENDDDLHEMMANQMKVFLDHKKPPPASVEAAIKDVSAPVTTIDNATFQIRPNSSDGLDESSSSNGASEMDIEHESLIQTEPLVSVDNSSVDADGFIIPEVSIKVTDMDQDDDGNLLIEDISFPNLSMSDETQQLDDHNRNDLSTITEVTEYEQSQGSSGDEISSEIASHASLSEPLNSEIEKRLMSINDSMEEVNEAFKKIAIINRSPSSATYSTYSTDKDFVDSDKASTLEEKSELVLSPIDSESTIDTESQPTTSTPKVLMPDLIKEVSGSKDGDAF